MLGQLAQISSKPYMESWEKCKCQDRATSKGIMFNKIYVVHTVFYLISIETFEQTSCLPFSIFD
jgi:hypothetical protein